METRQFMTAIIQMPVEIFKDGTYQIYTDLYKIDFLSSLDDPDLRNACMNTDSSVSEEEEDDPDLESEGGEDVDEEPQTPLIETITQILAREIKPRRRNRTSANTSFKQYLPSRKSNMRFSRKQKDPIHISSGTEDAGLLEAKTATA
jgi:hypothetical protein